MIMTTMMTIMTIVIMIWIMMITIIIMMMIIMKECRSEIIDKMSRAKYVTH